MPLVVEHPSPPTGPAARRTRTAAASLPDGAALRVALINNMPDAALADTEEQFLSLLAAAAGAQPIRLALHCLPTLPRGPEARARLAREYFGLPELLDRDYDGVIITGTEPMQANLRAEPYWPELAAALRWAENHCRSAILSCLAAHAAVLDDSGITRQPLARKRIGVFPEKVARSHPLTRGARSVIHVPHSRWNEIRPSDLAAHGYEVLTRSPAAGAGLFVKRRGRSLFVHLQGHPEYQATTLLKEYRRDVRRFLLGQHAVYPSWPHNCFDRESQRALADFQQRATARPDPALMAEFPEEAIAARLRRTWETDAVLLYRNWLAYLSARPESLPAASSAHRNLRSAAPVHS